MAKAEASVEELVGMIERGELRLPEMQRRYVWRSTRVRDLLDSLYRGYPSGAILLWEGQPVSVRGRRRPIELLFNLEHPDEFSVVTEVNEEQDDDDDAIEDEVDSSEDELQRRFERMTFLVATRKLEQLPHWVKVTEVFKTDEDAPFLERVGIEKVNDPRFKKYSQRLARLRGIRKYMYRMDVLERVLSYNEVTEIFVRVNSLGAKLRSSDLALAQITAKWRNSLKIFQAFQEKCAKVGFDLDLGLHLKSSETLLDQDLATLRQGGGATEMLDRLRLQVGRLDVTADELEGRNQRSALFKNMFLAFRAAGAKDWRSNLSISLDHSGAQHRLQFHHIFPKGVLKGAYTAREADDIANLSFIGGKTNRAISDKAPVDYLPSFIEKSGQAAFDAQGIPTESSLLRPDAYKAFLTRRREMIAERLNMFLGTAPMRMDKEPGIGMLEDGRST